MASVGLSQTLHPGDVLLAEAGDCLETLLGSCVALLLTDSHHTIGVMSHIVSTQAPRPERQNDTRFATPALLQMFYLLRSRGYSPQYCEAWLIGGGHMFPTQTHLHHVGAANVEVLKGLLERHGIRIVGESVGGHFYRKVTWQVGRNAPDIRIEEVDDTPGVGGLC